ncbi:MAG: winged helix-turn-helix domain-containing protein [Candidatus Bathyarchaeia archaeon]
MGNYRGRLDILADILDVVSNKAKKTQIMYRANLSYKVLQRYLSELAGASLITFEDENRCYMLTEKGLEFLQTYREYDRSSRSIEKRLRVADNKKRRLFELCPP